MKTYRDSGDRDADKGEDGLDLRGSATRSRWLGRRTRLTAQLRPFKRPPQSVHFDTPSPVSPDLLEKITNLVLDIHSSVTNPPQARPAPPDPLFSVPPLLKSHAGAEEVYYFSSRQLFLPSLNWRETTSVTMSGGRRLFSCS